MAFILKLKMLILLIRIIKKNKDMKLLKFTLAIYAIVLAVLAIILIWNEDTAKCGLTTCKAIETLFICVSLLLTRDLAKIKDKN